MVLKFPFFKRKKKTIEKNENIKKIPEHVAIIMDGNGRWAAKRNLPRIAGHKEGVDAVQRAVRAASSYGVKVLTMYAFSTENWQRPRPEVDFILRLPKEFLHVYLPELMEMNVKIETFGNQENLPPHTLEAINYAKNKTKDNDGLLLNFALNYGSRDEITSAIRRVAEDLHSGSVQVDEIDESTISQYLYTDCLKDPDLLIRTSGEQRLSNFLLWQLAYTEFWFTDVLWPDFDEETFEAAILEYQKRQRRYGGIEEED
ncbi:MAG TPA: isoprenyl transferase [Pseudogracilibacillus sp.]|nr:isoprenyl transferase [Pseudogracilibacillus sp.]